MKAAKLLRRFSRAEFERCGSRRSSHKVMLNNRKPIDLHSPLVECPDIHPSALPLVSYVCALELRLGCGHEDRGLSWPARHFQFSWMVTGLWFHGTGWDREMSSVEQGPPRPCSRPSTLLGGLALNTFRSWGWSDICKDTVYHQWPLHWTRWLKC